MEDLGLADEIAGMPFATAFTWNSATYTGAISGITDTKTLESGGFALGEDQDLVCATAQFVTTRPESEQTVTIGANTLRIEAVVTSPCGTFLVLRLKTEAKGA